MRKDKKKAKKTAKAGGKEEIKEDPIVVVPEPPPTSAIMDEFDGWGAGKKDKKTKKKSTFDWGAEPDPIADLPPPPPPPPPPVVETDDWMGAGWADTTKKKDKKSKKGVAIEEISPVVPDPVVEKPAEEDWGFGNGWGAAKKDATKDVVKDKKTKKSKFDIEASPPPEPIVEEKKDEDWFSNMGTAAKKDKKTTKKGKLEPDPPIVEDMPMFEEPKVDDDDWMGTWTTGKKAKDKKTTTKTKGITEIVEASPGNSGLLPDSVQEKSIEEDTWGTWGNVGKKEKKKVGKKGRSRMRVHGFI